MAITHTAELVTSLLGATLALLACGGGNGDSFGMNASVSSSISQAEATNTGANAATLGSDTGLVADQTVQTLQVMLGVGTGQGVGLTCPGGGSATIDVSGASPASQLNGQFDAGEVYNLTLASCRAAAGAPAISGTSSVTVVATDASSTTLTLATSTALSGVLPAGAVNLNGNFTLVRSSTGATTNSHVTASSLTLSRGASSRVFTLSAVDLILAVTRAPAGTLQALAYSGSHTVSANQSLFSNLSYSVATTGSVNYDASAQPLAGSWMVTLPRQSLTLALTGGQVRLTADFGKDGTVDLDTTFPRATLLAAVG